MEIIWISKEPGRKDPIPYRSHWGLDIELFFKYLAWNKRIWHNRELNGALFRNFEHPIGDFESILP